MHLFTWIDIHSLRKDQFPTWLKDVPAIVAVSTSDSRDKQPNIYLKHQVSSVVQSIIGQFMSSSSQQPQPQPQPQPQHQQQQMQMQMQMQQQQQQQPGKAVEITSQAGTNVTINTRIAPIPKHLYSEEKSFKSLPSAVSGRSSGTVSRTSNSNYQTINVPNTGISPTDSKKFAVTNAPIMDQPRPEITNTVLPFADEWSSKYSGSYAFVDPDMPIPSYSFSAATGSTLEIVNDGVRRSFEANKNSIGKQSRSSGSTEYKADIF